MTKRPQPPAVPLTERWRLYEQRKAEFVRQNPGASPEDYEAACQRIAQELGL